MEVTAHTELAPGSPVEVRTRFDGSWVRGFEIISSAADGYRIMRVTDRVTIPGVFRSDEIAEDHEARSHE